MSLITGFYPQNGNVFTRNPIIVKVNAPTLATYTVSVGETVIFTGNGVGAFTVNLADILESVFTETETPAGNGYFLPYQAGSNKLSYKFMISTDNAPAETLMGIAWKGGINKKDFRTLCQENSDVFTKKMLDYSGNFFFTSRTYGWTITMKETEIEPLAFIMPEIVAGENGHIVIVEAVTHETLTVEGTPDTFGALNIEAVRKYFFTEYGVLANIFDVMDPYYPSRVACRIAIEKAQESVERCAVRFLNSFGVYERIDLVGSATIQTAEAQEENTIFQAYDEFTDSFVKSRNRTEIGLSYKVKTGVKRGDELAFIQDMLASDSVYLVLPGQEIKVIPMVEQNNRAYIQTTPESMEITFQPIENESNFTAVRTKYGARRPRIFTSVFSEQFN